MATMSDAAKLWCAANDDPTAGDDIVAAAAEQLGIKVPPEVANIEAAILTRSRTSGAVPVPDDVAEAFIEFYRNGGFQTWRDFSRIRAGLHGSVWLALTLVMRSPLGRRSRR